MDEAEKLVKLIEQQYQTRPIKLHLVASGWKKVYRLEHAASPAWIVRAYPPPGDEGPPVNVEALAAVLLFLEEQAYPAERVVRAANQASVIQDDGWQVLITTFIGQALTAWQPADQSDATEHIVHQDHLDEDPQILFGLGAALGRLHTLPPPSTLPQAGMLPSRELAWAATNLVEIAAEVPDHLQPQYQHLRTMTQDADRYEDLPFVLIHNDCNPSNAVMTPTGEITLIDWESAGRGPALIDVGILLSNCFSKRSMRIDQAAIVAIVDGYCQYRQLTTTELARLPDAIRFFRLVLLAGYFPELINQTVQPTDLLYGATYAQWQAQYEASDEIAALAREAFSRYR
ncbi:MAG: phosphotransferase [Chloroflexi bacterium]|nr:phosphotransferase [Chloroflexota bacterium]